MSVKKRVWLAAGLGFLIGLISLYAFRFFTVQRVATHYHANFALYTDGQREMFKNFSFYEEVSACNENGTADPKTRVHMHGNVNDVVHVHDVAVTWSAFFSNLGYALGDKSIQTETGTYVDGANGKKLTFILNGKPVTAIANRVVQSEDTLLINYGSDDQPVLQARYDAIPHTAHGYNETADPSTCSGSQPFTITERAKSALGF